MGIRLNNTGVSGGVRVTGNPSGACGGTVIGTLNPATTLNLGARTTNPADCSGGQTQHETGTGGGTTGGSSAGAILVGGSITPIVTKKPLKCIGL